MQDEIVARLANTLNAQLVAAEARRAERVPHPDSMDLYFQGMACVNKGPSPEYQSAGLGRPPRAHALKRGSTVAPKSSTARKGSAATLTENMTRLSPAASARASCAAHSSGVP